MEDISFAPATNQEKRYWSSQRVVDREIWDRDELIIILNYRRPLYYLCNKAIWKVLGGQPKSSISIGISRSQK